MEHLNDALFARFPLFEVPSKYPKNLQAAADAVCASPPQVQRLVLSYASAWAASSPTNRLCLGALGLNQALAQVASGFAELGDPNRASQVDLLRLMDCMSGDGAATTDAEMAGWVRPLLFLAADAAGGLDIEVAGGWKEG